MNESNMTKVITFNPLGKYDSVRPTVTPFKATYEEMTEMKSHGKLIPGQYYQITDYVTTVNGATITNARSAGHPFDLLVRADSADTLNEQAWAVRHDGDTYFQDARLEAWQLKYRLDNVQWSQQDGRGTITWMKDEHGNECPYDFKNVQFKRYKTTDSVSGREGLDGKYMVANPNSCPHGVSVGNMEDFIWAYTFSSDNSGGEQTDYSLTGSHQVHDNVMKPYSGGLPNNVMFGANNYSNSFGVDCYNNSWGNNCGGNSWGNSCYSNSWGNGCNGNSWGSYCSNNSWGNNCYINSLGNSCGGNSWGNGCSNNSWGNNCSGNSWGNNCGGNSWGNSCYSNSWGNGCSNNSWGIGCSNNSWGNNVTQSTLFDGVQFTQITTENVKNVQVLNGVAGTSSSKLTLTFEANKTYTQVAAMTSAGALKIYVPGDIA